MTNGNVKWLIDKKRYCTEVVDFLSGVRLRELKTKENVQVVILKVSAAAYGKVRLREGKNTEFVWELKRGFKQGGRK